MFVKSTKFLPASIKSMNPTQKYPHIIELFACTRKILAIIFLFPIISLIFLGTYSTPISLLLQTKAIQCVPTSAYLSYVCPYVCPNKGHTY